MSNEFGNNLMKSSAHDRWAIHSTSMTYIDQTQSYPRNPVPEKSLPNIDIPQVLTSL
jgi:hypothetical protein